MKKIVALFGKNKEEILAELKKTEGYEIDLLEIRADYLEDISLENIGLIVKRIKEERDTDIILTLRTKREGGFYEGLDYAVKVHSFLDLNMEYIDLQINELTDQAMKDLMTHAKARNTKVILSVHHISRGISEGIFQHYINKAKTMGADIVKIVDMPENMTEVISKLILSGKYAQTNDKPELISISMGGLGTITRYKTNIYEPEYTYINITDMVDIGQIRIEDMNEELASDKIINFFTTMNTILGKIYIYSDLNGIVQLTFEEGRKQEKYLDIKYEDAILTEALVQINEYFTKERENFELKLSTYAKGFEKEVYDKLMTVKYGQTVTYKELARMAGKEEASRAVGNAMAKNRIPLIIPCHRVIKSTGQIGEYTGGSHRKKLLLTLESEN